MVGEMSGISPGVSEKQHRMGSGGVALSERQEQPSGMSDPAGMVQKRLSPGPWGFGQRSPGQTWPPKIRGRRWGGRRELGDTTARPLMPALARLWPPGEEPEGWKETKIIPLFPKNTAEGAREAQALCHLILEATSAQGGDQEETHGLAKGNHPGPTGISSPLRQSPGWMRRVGFGSSARLWPLCPD